MRDTKLKKQNGFYKGRFMAMASPCHVLMEIDDELLAHKILNAVANEAWRIEDKFSRYKSDNILFQINHSNGHAIRLDDETLRLFDFAHALFEISGGLFDVTSGVLRQCWRFDGSDKIPTRKQVKKIVRNIGWQKITREQGSITVPEGMEIDLGGLGKEYAVDRCVQLARQFTQQSVLVNFGGDIAMTASRKNRAFWSVGRFVTGSDNACGLFQLYSGAIATSGDANRYLLKNGVRYSHILNPETGWSITDAPHTVSVAAATCIEAGMMSTLAMLQGGRAEDFLKMQKVEYWID